MTYPESLDAMLGEMVAERVKTLEDEQIRVMQSYLMLQDDLKLARREYTSLNGLYASTMQDFTALQKKSLDQEAELIELRRAVSWLSSIMVHINNKITEEGWKR